jgi:hypothetical protein
MKSRTARRLGRTVKVEPDGPLGVVVGVASQDRRPMLQLRFTDDSTKWVPASDTTPADPGE